jgi:hypothetical protein
MTTADNSAALTGKRKLGGSSLFDNTSIAPEEHRPAPVAVEWFNGSMLRVAADQTQTKG